MKKGVGMCMVGLMQFLLYYIFLFCRFTDQACGERTSWMLLLRRSATATPTQESSDCEKANVTFIEKDPRKTKVLVSGLQNL